MIDKGIIGERLPVATGGLINGREIIRRETWAGLVS